MKYLLDTHILLWWVDNNKKLTPEVRAVISNPHNLIFVSAVNIWEIEIKKSLGKLKAPEIDSKIIKACQFNELPVNIEHVLNLKKLPKYHADPFDRLLICQSIIEKMHLITEDKLIAKYDALVL